MANLPSIDLGWLGGGVGGLMRSGRATNEGGSSFGGQRTALKDFFEGSAAATDERFASEAKKARSLRTYLAEIDPTLKDKVQAMGLGDLEGHAMSLAEKKLEQKQKLNDEYMQQQIASMKSAEAERTRGAEANTAMARYAMQPAAQERWSAALAGGPTQAGADMLNAPLRAPTQQEGLAAYLRAMATGAAPDARSLAQFAPQENQRQRGAPQMTQLGGVDVIYNPYTGVFEQSALSRARASEDVQRNIIGARADAKGDAGYPPGSKVVEDNGVLILVGPDGTILKTLGQKRAPGMAEVVQGLTDNTAAPAKASGKYSIIEAK